MIEGMVNVKKKNNKIVDAPTQKTDKTCISQLSRNDDMYEVPRYDGQMNPSDAGESYWNNWVEINEGQMVADEPEDDIFYEKLKNMNLTEEMERNALERADMIRNSEN